MLTQTSELAVKTLIYLALESGGQPLSPRKIAGPIGCSPSYLAKTVALLVRAGILSSVRGSAGGVLLAKGPSEISLLNVVEVCQGLITAPYCKKTGAETLCSFHSAMVELHEAIADVLSKWTLEDLLRCPVNVSEEPHLCHMVFEGCESHVLHQSLQGTEGNFQNKE